MLHFTNILHYAQYCNCSISIIPCTMHSTPTAPLLSSTAVWNSVSFCAAHTLLFILLSNTNWILLYSKQCRNQAICIAHCFQTTRKVPFLCRQWLTECYGRWQRSSNCDILVSFGEWGEQLPATVLSQIVSEVSYYVCENGTFFPCTG